MTRLLTKYLVTFQPPGEKPNPRVSVIKGDDVELRCRAEADQLLDMAYSWKLNGLTIRYTQSATYLVTLCTTWSHNLVTLLMWPGYQMSRGDRS